MPPRRSGIVRSPDKKTGRRPLTDIVGVYNPHDPQLTDALAQVTDPVDIVFCCLGTTRRE
ncbi:hypothetical protein MJI37_34070, partial [Salmonella enterica subsp. enterica serovar Cerro]|nr:hypothetical protein [Salmonella enterica subsp. enterica serovar Cerro]